MHKDNWQNLGKVPKLRCQLNYFFNKADLQVFFSAFYGQRSVTAVESVFIKTWKLDTLKQYKLYISPLPEFCP